MLSFLFNLANNYEQEHGYRPNVLYLNQTHFHSLQEALAEIKDLQAINHFLGMEIVLTDSIKQPHLAWSAIKSNHAVKV